MTSTSETEIIQKMHLLACEAVERDIDGPSVVLYSGGVDSAVLARLMATSPKESNVRLYSAGIPGSIDHFRFTSFLDLAPQRIVISKEDLAKAALELTNICDPFSLASFEDCLAFLLMFEALKRENSGDLPRSVFAANGPDELFCGYDRFRRIVDEHGYEAVTAEIERALKLANRLGREVGRIASHFGFALKQPFLDPVFVEYCKNEIPPDLKIVKQNDVLRKRIWRRYASWLGLPDEIVLRPKKAMQYSMGIHKAVIGLFKVGTLKKPTFEISSDAESGET